MKADEILDALIAISSDKLWATELPFRGSKTRIDFWTLEPMKSKGFRASAYEIKVTKADFKRDTEAKQSGALRYSDRFWYATPDGLIAVEEVPCWAGLMTWNGKRFSIKKKAPKREKESPDWGVFVDVVRNSGQCRRDVQLLQAEARQYKAFWESERARNTIAQEYRNSETIKKFSRRILRSDG